MNYCLSSLVHSSLIIPSQLIHLPHFELRQSFFFVSDRDFTAGEDKHLIKSHKMLSFLSSILNILQQVGVFNFPVKFPVSLVELFKKNTAREQAFYARCSCSR